MFTTSFTLLLGIVGLVQGHAGHKHVRKRQDAPELSELLAGNGRFQAKIQAESPTLLSDLTSEGQAPPFMFLGCSDSRVSEGTIFDAAPGTLFTERNIANRFSPTDSNSNTVVSYAVAELGVKHIIVMGHYGCGGVAAAIASPPAAPVDAANGAVQSWIAPIRTLFETSTRPEIVTLRESIAGRTDVEEPEPEEPGFRALVEENIKVSVSAIAATSVIQNHYESLAGLSAEEKRAEGGPPEAVFIHGWVYDIENGQIQDLNISVGPPGVAIPPAPFSAVKQAAEGVEPTAEPAVEAAVEPLQNSADSESAATICKNKCISKRRLQGSY